EDVWPQLAARVDAESAVLAVKPREMAKLALTHKHLTVKARTVNQRLFHQWCMDQFYWYVDEETLVGYQWPIALVAIKPERVITEPVLVWDFGYLPEAAPTLEPCFLADSDDFFMIEPQKRVTGEELVRPGGISVDAIAKFLSDWTTHEQRRCGRQLLMIHAGDLPVDLDEVIAESRRYMNEIAPAVARAAVAYRARQAWALVHGNDPAPQGEKHWRRQPGGVDVSAERKGGPRTVARSPLDPYRAVRAAAAAATPPPALARCLRCR